MSGFISFILGSSVGSLIKVKIKYCFIMKKKLLILLFICCVKVNTQPYDNFELPRIPERCFPNPDLLYRQCCIFPPFFKRDIARICGAWFTVTFTSTDNNNATGFRREVNDACEHWKCILRKYSILTAEGNADDAKFYTHLDKWVSLNPEFYKVMLTAKLHCKQRFKIYMPLKSCEFMHFQKCIRNYVIVNCPTTIPTQECDELKSFYQECRQYYLD